MYLATRATGCHFLANNPKAFDMSDEAGTPAKCPKVKFSDLHPGERFSYDKTNTKNEMDHFMKTDARSAKAIGRDVTLTFDETDRDVEVYAIDRDPQ
jgi:hypothetical protein